MKTSLLNQLSKEITHGEWTVQAGTIIESERVAFARCLESSEICGDPMTEFDRTRHNAQAISLTPQLIREVLELRNGLHLALGQLEGIKPKSGVHSSSLRTDIEIIKSLLTRHETTNQ